MSVRTGEEKTEVQPQKEGKDTALRITALVTVNGTGKLAFVQKSSTETIEIGDGFTREQIEEQLKLVNDMANKKLKHMKMVSEMKLVEIEGKPV